MAGSMNEKGLERRHGQEVFLRLAAYRALHEGALPPSNSDLWREYARLRNAGTGRGPFAPRRRWFFRRYDADRERRLTRPLASIKLEKAFLTDDFSPDKVDARLESWAMITAFGMVDRHPMGEWFLYCMEVRAEDVRQAAQIVECIFALPAP
jgi:hypothetical protein